MGTRLIRTELYQLVWLEPLRKLSKRFGTSDVALAKRCRVANIPLPGLGYWAKKEAGKPVFQPALPQRGLGQSDFIEFGTGERRSYVEEAEELLRTASPLQGEASQAMTKREPYRQSHVRRHHLGSVSPRGR